MSSVGAASLVVLIGAFLAAFGGPAHAQPALEFTNTPPLKLTLADKQDTSVECDSETGQQKEVQRADSGPRLKTANATVWVRYADSAEALNNVRFDARAKANSPGATGAAWKDVSVCWHRVDAGQSGGVEPFEVFFEVASPPNRTLPEWKGWRNLLGNEEHLEKYWAWFWNPDLPYEWSSLSGYLTVTAQTAEGEAVPGALALQLISPAQGYSDWFWRVMTKVAFWYFVAVLAAGLFLALVLSGARTNFFKELDFDMKGGWASNLTTAGAVLGTVLSAGLLPDDPFFMSKSQYTALNVVFALALVLAYLIYRLFPLGVVLLFAGAIVLAAAAGEIVTVCLILYEITFRGVLPPQIVPYMQLALIAAVLLASFVAGKKFVGALKKGKGITEDKALVRGFYEAWAEKDAGKRNAAFDRVLHPNYRYRDYGTGEILDADGLKVRADRDHNEFRKIRFVFGDQSSGEGSIGSRITRKTEPKVGGARAADEIAFLDVSRVEGGTIARQLNKILPPAPPGPVKRSLAGLRKSLKRPRPDGRTNPGADGGSERATDGGARRGETG